MRDGSITNHCYFESPIGRIKISENEGFLTSADFVEQRHFKKLPDFEMKEPMNMERAIEFQCDLEDLCDYKYWTFSRNLKARIRAIICQVKNRQLPYYNNGNLENYS